MKKYRTLAVIIIFAGVIFFAGKLLSGKKLKIKDGEKIIRVNRGDVSVFVNVKAAVKPVNVVEIRSKAIGKIINMPFEKGDFLKEGALVAEIKNTFTKAAIEQASAELDAAKARLEKIKTEIEAEKDMDQRLIKTAEDNLEKAKRGLQKAIEKERMKEALKKNNIETESELIKQEVDIRFNIYEIQEKIGKLSKKETVPNKELESLKESLKSAQSEYELVLQYLELTKKPIVEEIIDAEKFGIKQAELELSRVKEKIKAREAEAKDFTAAETEVSDKQKALKLAEDSLKDTIVTAPIAGIVMQKNFEKGQKISSADPMGAVIAAMADLSRIYVNAEFDKKDLPNIKTGQWVKVTIDGFPGNDFKGFVKKIVSKKAAANNGGIFNMTVEIENSGKLLKPGTNLLFKIIIEEAKDVLFVQNDVIQNVGNKKKVFVIQDGKPVQREVTTGLKNRDFTEVILGLKEGETIIKPEKSGRDKSFGCIL